MPGARAVGSIDSMTTTRESTSVAPAPVPRWAVRVAHVIPLLTLPSGLWRIALALGFTAGTTQAGYDALMSGPMAVPYVVGLSVLSEALALLALGLVRPWGVVPPRWVPVLGGRRMRPWAVALAAGAGSAGLVALWTPTTFAWWATGPEGNVTGNMTETGHAVVGLLYMPLVAWGPLLALLTVVYYRRHRGLGGGGHQQRRRG